MTKEISIEEGNKIIAEFEQLKIARNGIYLHGSNFYNVDALKYHSSWDWLMPVVEKISRIEFDRDEQELPFGGIEIIIHTHYPRTFGMISDEGKPMFRYNACVLFIADTLIEAAWKATVDFIQWYNKNTQQ